MGMLLNMCLKSCRWQGQTHRGLQLQEEGRLSEGPHIHVTPNSKRSERRNDEQPSSKAVVPSLCLALSHLL